MSPIRTFRVFLAVFFLSALTLALTQEDIRPAPKNPESPFTFSVLADPKGDEKAKKSIKKGAEEVAKKLRKDKKWFHQVEADAQPDLLLDIKAHWVDERSYTRTETRYSAAYGNQLVDVNVMLEQHHLQAEAQMFGTARRMEGVDDSKAGGSAKNAGANLADQVKEYFRENYWELKERQALRKAAQRKQ